MSVVAKRDPQKLAQSVADQVGDGCTVSAFEPATGQLRTLAVAHRDSRRLEQLKLSLNGGSSQATGWQVQALERGVALRLTGVAAAEVASDVAAAAVLLPLQENGCVTGLVTAIRDTPPSAYTRRDQALLERLTGHDDGHDETSPLEPARLLDHVAAGVWVTDSQGISIYVNDALCTLLGHPSDAVVGAPMADFIDEVPLTVTGPGTSDTERRDHRLLSADQEELWVDASSVPLTHADGRRYGTVTTVTDVTRRKAAEVEVRMRLAGFEAVAELTEWAENGEPIETLVHGVAAAVADLLGVDRVAIVEAADGGAEVVPRALVGWDPSRLGASFEVSPLSAVAVALEGNDPIVIDDLDHQANPFLSSPAVTEAGMRSGVWIGVGDGLGAIAAHDPDVKAFGHRDLSFLRSLARVLAVRWEAQPPDLVTV